MTRRRPPTPPAAEIPSDTAPVVLYSVPGEAARVELLRTGGNVWATQAQMAELFQPSVAKINIHLRNIFAEGEVDPAASVKSYLIDQVQRKSTVRREVRHYDLAVVLVFLAALPGVGRVIRDDADRHALAEYAQFEDRRRALAEAAGADDALAGLLTATQALSDKDHR